MVELLFKIYSNWHQYRSQNSSKMNLGCLTGAPWGPSEDNLDCPSAPFAPKCRWWIPSGSHVDPTWTPRWMWIPRESQVDPKRIPGGSQVDRRRVPKWIPSGSQVDPEWIPSGSRAGASRIPHRDPQDPHKTCRKTYFLGGGASRIPLRDPQDPTKTCKKTDVFAKWCLEDPTSGSTGSYCF